MSKSRLARHVLIAALVTWHGAVTLCGMSLHALPGLGHASGLHPRAKNDHSHGPGKSAHDAADDCQICQVLAQGQIAPDPTCGMTGWLVAGVTPPVLRSATLAAPVLPSIPRGPPSSPAVPC